jgi:hypothetical protein
VAVVRQIIFKNRRDKFLRQKRCSYEFEIRSDVMHVLNQHKEKTYRCCCGGLNDISQENKLKYGLKEYQYEHC